MATSFGSRASESGGSSFHFGAPGLRSYIALAVGGVLQLAATRHEAAVVWMLAHGTVPESAVEGANRTVQLLAVAASGLAAVFAWRLVVWPLVQVASIPAIQVPRVAAAHAFRALGSELKGAGLSALRPLATVVRSAWRWGVRAGMRAAVAVGEAASAVARYAFRRAAGYTTASTIFLERIGSPLRRVFIRYGRAVVSATTSAFLACGRTTRNAAVLAANRAVEGSRFVISGSARALRAVARPPFALAVWLIHAAMLCIVRLGTPVIRSSRWAVGGTIRSVLAGWHRAMRRIAASLAFVGGVARPISNLGRWIVARTLMIWRALFRSIGAVVHAIASALLACAKTTRNAVALAGRLAFAASHFLLRRSAQALRAIARPPFALAVWVARMSAAAMSCGFSVVLRGASWLMDAAKRILLKLGMPVVRSFRWAVGGTTRTFLAGWHRALRGITVSLAFIGGVCAILVHRFRLAIARGIANPISILGRRIVAGTRMIWMVVIRSIGEVLHATASVLLACARPPLFVAVWVVRTAAAATIRALLLPAEVCLRLIHRGSIASRRGIGIWWTSLRKDLGDVGGAAQRCVRAVGHGLARTGARAVLLGHSAVSALRGSASAVVTFATPSSLFAAIAVLAGAGAAAFFSVGFFGPKPPVVITNWATPELTSSGLLDEMAARFNEAGYREADGRRVEVRLKPVSGQLMSRYLMARIQGGGVDLKTLSNGEIMTDTPEPDLVTAPGLTWFTSLNSALGEQVVDTDASWVLASSPVGIATYRDMALCLGWPYRPVGFDDLLAMKQPRGGWGALPCASRSWGRDPIVVFADPATSGSGRAALIGLYSVAAGVTPGELDTTGVSSTAATLYIDGLQQAIDRFAPDSLAMISSVAGGPRLGQFFVTSEFDLRSLQQVTQDEMVMMYPAEGAPVLHYCACPVNAEWVNEARREAVRIWVDFLKTDALQDRFAAAGLRPVDELATEVDALDPAGANTTLVDTDAVSPAVLGSILSSWADMKRPAVVVFALDTSGSMLGPKMRQAKDGLTSVLRAMPGNSEAGLVTFSDTARNEIGVEKLSGNLTRLTDVIEAQTAGGETALYDAIELAVGMADGVTGQDARRAVVVLTDGQANRGSTRLDQLIAMESTNEKPVVAFSGFAGSDLPADSTGARVQEDQVFGVSLRMATGHDVQIFFVGVGSDANLDVGRLLAEATGAEFKGVPAEDLANVLSKFNGYF